MPDVNGKEDYRTKIENQAYPIEKGWGGCAQEEFIRKLL